jgi:hypothetical protein
MFIVDCSCPVSDHYPDIHLEGLELYTVSDVESLCEQVAQEPHQRPTELRREVCADFLQWIEENGE